MQGHRKTILIKQHQFILFTEFVSCVWAETTSILIMGVTPKRSTVPSSQTSVFIDLKFWSKYHVSKCLLGKIHGNNESSEEAGEYVNDIFFKWMQ